MTDWLIDWLSETLVDWSIDWLIDWFWVRHRSKSVFFKFFLVWQSIAFLAGPPIITYLRDVNGSYIPGFMTLSLCLVCGASLIVLEHFLTLCLSRRNGSPPRKDPESNHDRVNHEMEALPTTTAAGATPSDDTVDILPVKPINFSPPFAHIDEFDTLTPRPVLKPVFKPKLRKHKGL